MLCKKRKDSEYIQNVELQPQCIRKDCNEVDWEIGNTSLVYKMFVQESDKGEIAALESDDTCFEAFTSSAERVRREKRIRDLSDS